MPSKGEYLVALLDVDKEAYFAFQMGSSHRVRNPKLPKDARGKRERKSSVRKNNANLC